MQVSHAADRVTHAIIGGKEAQSLRIDDEGSLFYILSTALYSDKPLALVREVVCNAWDSHIESGRTDKPLEIKLDWDRLSIRDFGHGIHRDDIVKIYGTYGGSTKKDNGEVTGGFGLGSKAPFAYTEHFEVISHHDGVKTIYKMSQSSAVVGGKPSIAEIVSVPTTETGLEVNIQLKDRNDRHRFTEIIHQIVSFGEMNVLFNLDEIETIPFSKAVNGFLMMQRRDMNRSSAKNSSIAIRLGHVIYPLEEVDEFSLQYNRVIEFLKSADRSRSAWEQTTWTVVLQAPADSISVTPSRESLSMTDRTITTITELLDKFLQHTEGKLERVCSEYNADAIKQTWMLGSPQELLNTDKRIPNINRVERTNPKFISDFDTLGRYYITQGYPQIAGFRDQDIMLRLDALLEAGFGNRGLIQGFKKALIENGKVADTASEWFHRKYATSILKGMIGSKDLDSTKLFVYGEYTKKYYTKDTGFIPITKWPKGTLESYLPFLRNVVILSHNRTDIDRAYTFPVMRFWLGSAQNTLFYAVPRSSAKLDAARAHFVKLGMTIIDLTVRQAWEPKPERVINFEPRKPRKKGLPILRAAVTENARQIEISQYFADDAERIIEPEFIFRINSKEGNRLQKNNWSTVQSLAIIRLFGDKGGVVVNSTQEQKFQALGIPLFAEYMMQCINAEYKTNPLIQQYYEYHSNDGNYQTDTLYTAICGDDVLRQEYNIPELPNQRVQDIVTLFDSFYHWNVQSEPLLKEIHDLIKTWTMKPDAKALIDLIKIRPGVKFINYEIINTALRGMSATPQSKDMARNFLRLALKG